MAETPLSEVKGVWQAFTLPNGKPLSVLEDINLPIREREIVCLLGPSGCGKSTILRILAGLIQPTRGEVLYHGRPLAGLNPGIAIVFQSFALYPWMTVTENSSMFPPVDSLWAITSAKANRGNGRYTRWNWMRSTSASMKSRRPSTRL